MIFPAYGFSSGFVKTGIEFRSFCPTHCIVKSRTVRHVVVSLSNSQDNHHFPEDASKKKKQSSDTSAASPASSFSTPPSMVGNAETNDQYEAFKKMLGLEPHISKTGYAQPGRSVRKSGSVDAKQTTPEPTSVKTGWGESKDKPEIDPSEYAVFDQLLTSTRGPQRKLVKGSRPYSTTFHKRRADVPTEISPDSTPDQSDKDATRPHSFNDYSSEGSKELDNQLSRAESYDIMREQFGDGFHENHPKPDPGRQENDKPEKKEPLILSERPRHPDSSAAVKENTIVEFDIKQENHKAPNNPAPLPRPELKKPPQRPILSENLLDVGNTLSSVGSQGSTENMGSTDELTPPILSQEFVERSDLESQLKSLSDFIDGSSTFNNGFQDDSTVNRAQLTPRPVRTEETHHSASSLSSGVVRASPRRSRPKKRRSQNEAHVLREPKIVENII
ncbi:hypothetical protein BWQ96_01542 [Gracilariopsis chorda]|uniref:Uncharacterized protein n=1 Tax=Gracilariopsis chorda TaxID=448386 RepID=A0A2V3J5M8_9FLOR|nr:hypothetical protein BWQ96_01542 [Gracilariopsis chorda]|eukprot:PXF48690.1 hypothetical protein BWQ96_01542 [Gracilariopsis chorda]